MKTSWMVGAIGTLCLWAPGALAQVPESDATDDEAMADEPMAEGATAAEGDGPEEGAPEEADAAEAEEGDEASGGMSSKEGGDGGRFRFGVAGGAGPLIINSGDVVGDIPSFTYGGVDLRFGYQINNAIGVYVQPQMGFYWTGGGTGLFGTGGLVGASLLGEYTFIDRIFVGAGLGYGVLNNPAGLELHARVGGYPLMGKSKEKVRRKGLMLGLDFRVHLVSQNGVSYTGIAPTFNIGYEAF